MFEALLKNPTDNTGIQLVRYTLVGGVAFLVDFGLLFMLTEYAGMHYLAAAAVAFLGGLTTNYALSVSWVFSRRSMGSGWMELPYLR